jgi:hypothetical protein
MPPAFKNQLFSKVEYGGDEIAVEYTRGSARTSPYTSKYKRAIAIPRKPFQSSWVSPPHIKVSRDIRALDLLARLPGESIGGKLSAEERLAAWQIEDYLTLDEEIARAEEKQCSDVLFTGKLEIVDGDDSELLQTIDFGSPNTLVVDPAKFWDLAAGDPLADLTALKQVIASSGYMASFYCLGADATQAFLGNQKVKDAYNQFNFRPGTIDPKVLQELENFGVVLLGNYWGMDIFSYTGMFEAEDHKMHYYQPVDSIVVASKAAQNRFAYGQIVQTEDGTATNEGWGRAVGTYQLPRVPQYVTDGTTDQLLFRLWSRPLAVPVNVKTSCVATVCTLKSQPIPVNP